MITLALEKLLGRERVIVGGALAALMVLAWSYLIWLSSSMSPAIPDTPGMQMSDSMTGIAGVQMTETLRPWTTTEFFLVFAMWSVMMVGMMTPAVAPTILAYVRLARHPVARNQPLAPTGWFLGGYLLAWLCFALVASLFQAAFLQTGLIAPTLRSSSSLFGAAVFIAAGIYQLSPAKDACLSRCRAPLSFIHRNGGFRPGSVPSLKLGLRHGLYCVGCCWALMAVLFVVGVMELLWIAALSIWVLLEKVAPAAGPCHEAALGLLSDRRRSRFPGEGGDLNDGSLRLVTAKHARAGQVGLWSNTLGVPIGRSSSHG